MRSDIRFPTSDGGELVGDLLEVDGAWAGAVVCHPHPGLGGDRHNLVVDRLFHTFAGAGVTALRFDFRGAEATRAAADVVATLDRVADAAPDRPLWLAGYSFGADIALTVDDPRVAGWVAVAPPFRFGGDRVPARADRGEGGGDRGGEGDRRPVLLVAATHDQFHPADQLRAAAAGWPTATVVEVPGADHFFAGATQRAADAVVAWLDATRGDGRKPGPGPGQTGDELR
ncbi:MAG TPA: hypothetical protein VIL36_04895 [Acidimicrobiales bacterium]